MENQLTEFAQISVARLIDMASQIQAKDVRIQALEDHINNLEKFLIHACEDANYDWVTINIKDINRLIYTEEKDEHMA